MLGQGIRPENSDLILLEQRISGVFLKPGTPKDDSQAT